ncbi:S8 family peptidase [Micromonospora sp. BQ11]|uniref:S8 family peptidase n=1 Tax=Micromonospora sp. BQ11 TaxID=3452212 RepID=UPI003F898101
MSQDSVSGSHHLDQLVVDVQHLEPVEALLGELGVQYAEQAPEDRDDLLGLARLRELRDAGGGDLDVGEVLALLRQRAAAERDGWQPMIGKNRVVDAVIGEGHKPMSAIGAVAVSGHKPMAGAEPKPVGAGEVTLASGGTPEAGRGVRVGLVDTPLAPPAPGTDEDPLPFRAGHATFVASLIRRQAPAAELHVEGVLDAATGRADSWDVARAIVRLARDQQLDLLNLSLGCYTIAGGPPLVIARAIERLGAGVLVVAAAGNHGALAYLTAGRTRSSACWPAAVAPTVAVGAVDQDGSVPEWSPILPWVTCSAPGVGVAGEYLTGMVRLGDGGVQRFTGQAQWSGTSFAAATVTGAIAARTVPGSATPRQALDDLLTEGTLIRRSPHA